jgi:hypothetical protein
METSVEQLIKERTFASLTGEELEQVKELCETEEEFQTMKLFFQELEGVSRSQKTLINPEIKNSLDSIFSAKHPGLRANWTAPEMAAAPVAPVIPLHQRTWVRVAAAAILILGTAPFWGLLKNDLPGKDNGITAQLKKPKTDEAAKTGTTSEKTPQSFNSESETIEDIQPIDELETAADFDQAEASISAEAAPVGGLTYQWTPPAYKIDLSDDVYTKENRGVVAYSIINTGETTQGFYATGNATAPSYLFGTATSSQPGAVTLSSVGRNADLYPNDEQSDRAALNALSLAQQPDDLLDLLVPAF